jgi:hypothetical protein
MSGISTSHVNCICGSLMFKIETSTKLPYWDIPYWCTQCGRLMSDNKFWHPEIVRNVYELNSKFC